MFPGSRSKKTVQRPWRPDFRDTQALPDTKVIRTGFLVNFLAIAITLVIVTIYVVKEYSLQSVQQTVESLRDQVAENTTENRSILDAGKRFRQSASIIEEVVAFDRQILDFPVFLKDLASIVPSGIVLTIVDMHSLDEAPEDAQLPPFLVELSGRIQPGGVVTPSRMLTDFQEAIAKLPSVAGRELQMDLTRFNRNNEFGYFDFTLQVVIPAEPGSSS